MSRGSSRKSTHEELMAASQAVEQEYNAVKRLKRLSIGNSLNFDPDLPPEEMDFEDLTYNDLQSHNKSILNNQSHQNRSNKESEPSPLNNNDEDVEDSELEDENDEFYDVDKMDFLDIDPDSSLTDSNMIWVPATAHPKLAPDNFRKHVQKTVKEINTKLQRANSVKSSLGIESTSVIEEEEEDNDGGKFIDAFEGDKENSNFLPNIKKSSASIENEQTRKPSLRELTEQLENLSQIAGLGSDDAVTLARSLSTKSIGISKIEKDVYNSSDIQPKKPSGSSKYSFHNKKVRASLYFEDDENDDYTEGDDLDEKLVQLDLKENQKHLPNENPLRRTKWSNYRKSSNKVQESSKNKLHPIHVYKDIQKIHNNVKRPLGKPQIETIKSKSPSSKLPALPPKQNKRQINAIPNGISKSNLNSSKSLPATPVIASKPAIPSTTTSTAPAKNNIQNNPYSSKVNSHSASSLNSIGDDFNTKPQSRLQSHSQVQQIIHSQPQSQKSPRSSSWSWLSKNKEKDLDKTKEKDKEEEKEKGKDKVKDILTDPQVPANHSRNRHMSTISDLENSKKLSEDTNDLGVKQADACLIPKSEESDSLISNLDKEREEDKVKEKKPSFTSFFKLKRDKQRTNSDVTEDTEPRLGFKKKRSQSHSTEASSPKTDFKSFFSSKNHKDNKDKKEQPGFGPGGLSVKIPTSANSSPLPSPNPSTTSFSLSNDNAVENLQSLNNSQFSVKANKLSSQLATGQLKSDSKSPASPNSHLSPYQLQHQQQSHFQSQQHQSQSQIQHQRQHQGNQQAKTHNPKQVQQTQRSIQPLSQIHNRPVQEQQNPYPLSHSAQSNGAQRKISQNQQKSYQQKYQPQKHQPKLKSKSQTQPQPQLKSRMQSQTEVQSQIQTQPQVQIQTQPQAESEPSSQSHPQTQIQSEPQVQSQNYDSKKIINSENLSEESITLTTGAESLPSANDKSTQLLKETLKVSSRTYKPNQPLEMRESAFGFPLPPVSHSTLVMLDYRLPIHVERAIYRLSHLKLADPKRPLYQQVLLSNFMYSYLNLVNHTLYLQQQEQAEENDENGLIPAVEEEPLNNTNYANGLVSESL